MAEVEIPIIGADFLKHLNLAVDLMKAQLIDMTTQFRGSCTRRSINATQVSITTLPKVAEQFSQLLRQYPELITPSDAARKLERGVCHHIETKGPPISATARRLSPAKYKQAKQEFDFMVQAGICRPSSSSWPSPLHMVPNETALGDHVVITDGSTASLSQIVTLFHIFRTPQLTWKIAQYFRNWISSARTLKIPMHPDDIHKTAIITPFGLFEFPTMTFGLRNAAQTFQRYIDQALRGLSFAFAYIDAI